MTAPRLVWAIVVPVKRLESAKSRLLLDPAFRAEVALALALDTVRAALASTNVERVVAVTDDARAAAELEALGAFVVPDTPDAGLNPALLHGARQALMTLEAAVAALSSDLPALRSSELADILEEAAQVPTAMVADAGGDGTTMLTARALADFAPAFGAHSRAAHLARGTRDLSALAGPTLRRDVDTIDDLRDAGRLGCGPATTALLRRNGRSELLGRGA
jgi:2-phospho-L-lactate guanylyltransferase